MKKSAIFVLILLLLPVISAVEFNMKTNLSQGETLMAKVSGYFLEPILKEDIFLYRRHLRSSMNRYVVKINDEFYIYAQLLEKIPDNYSIIIKNSRYMKGSQISEEEIVKNFSMTESIADFSIDPGFIVTKDDFFIEVQNLQDYKIDIDIKNIPEEYFIYQESSINLRSGEIKKINFELKNITQPVSEIIELSTENLKYEIPVYIFAEEIEIEPEEKQRDFKFEPLELKISLSTNLNATRVIYLYNIGEETLEDILLSISESLQPYLSLSIDEIEELEESSNIKIELYLFSEEEKTVEGQIEANVSENLSVQATIFLNFSEEYVPLDEENETVPLDDEDEVYITKTCSEWNGIICGTDEECEGTIEQTKDDNCCLGTCKKIKKSSTGKIIGWSMLVLIILFLIWFFKKKYKGAKKPFDLLKIAKGKKK